MVVNRKKSNIEKGPIKRITSPSIFCSSDKGSPFSEDQNFKFGTITSPSPSPSQQYSPNAIGQGIQGQQVT